jgi:hypothetical protein
MINTRSVNLEYCDCTQVFAAATDMSRRHASPQWGAGHSSLARCEQSVVASDDVSEELP